MKPYILGIVIIGILLWIAFCVLSNSQQVEGFATQNVNLNFCPRWAPQIQTAKGNTDCCEGTLVDGKCSANTFCTMSPPYENVQSCLDAWRKYFIDQSNKQCPATMPNYYEDVRTTGGVKGCSKSNIKEDGKDPVNTGLPRCRIYATERENREELDSCFIEKGKLAVKCPPYGGYRSAVENVRTAQGKFGSYVCVYTNAIGDRRSCNDENSLIALWDRQNPNWRTDRSKLDQLKNVSCNTFLAREAERKRLEELQRRAEAERRRAEEEKRKREEQANRFRNFFASWRDRQRKAAEDARRKMEEERQAAARRLREMQDRLRRCR